MSDDLFQIADQMRGSTGDAFASRLLYYAQEYRGLADLMHLWAESAEDPEEQAEIIADADELLTDLGGEAIRHGEKKVRFDDLDAVADDIMRFKDALRLEVESKMSLTDLAEKTGMPLPSLSRFFSQPSMPRRATLLKISEALGVDELIVQTDWAVPADSKSARRLSG